MLSEDGDPVCQVGPPEKGQGAWSGQDHPSEEEAAVVTCEDPSTD